MRDSLKQEYAVIYKSIKETKRSTFKTKYNLCRLNKNTEQISKLYYKVSIFLLYLWLFKLSTFSIMYFIKYSFAHTLILWGIGISAIVGTTAILTSASHNPKDKNYNPNKITKQNYSSEIKDILISNNINY
jgi:hypothetical protein